MRNPFRRAKPAPPFHYGDMVRYYNGGTADYMVIGCRKDWSGWHVRTFTPRSVAWYVDIDLSHEWMADHLRLIEGSKNAP